MSNLPILPAVITRLTDMGFKAVSGLTLRSVVSRELISSSNESNLSSDQKMYNDHWRKRRNLLQALAGWPVHTSFELRWTAHPDLQAPAEGQLWISILVKSIAADKDTAIRDAIQGYFRLCPILETHLPHLSFSPISEKQALKDRLHPFVSRSTIAIRRLRRRISLSNPLPRTAVGFGAMVSEQESTDFVDLEYPWSMAEMASNEIAKALMALYDPIQLVIQLTPHNATSDELQQLEQQVVVCERYLEACSGDRVASKHQVSMIRDIALSQLSRINEASFSVKAFIQSSASIDSSLANSLAQLLLAPASVGGNGNLFVGGHVVCDVSDQDDLTNYNCKEAPVSVPEAAAIFPLPLPINGEAAGLPVRRWRTAAITSGYGDIASDKGTVLFDSFHHERLQPVSLSNEDRMRHMFVVGATGTGKSVFLANMILNDVEQGRGVCVIDPHGDLVESILSRMPQKRADDVILFDVLSERPVGFNLLEWYTIEERDIIIDELYNAMDFLYNMKETGGPIFEHHFRNMLRLLCGDGSCERLDFFPTVLEFIRCYLEDDMRQWLSNRTAEAGVKDFVKEMERTNYGDIQLRNVAPYITSKFGRFTSDTRLRRIFGQDTTPFLFDDILQQGKIFLVKLGRGRWGSLVSSLLASQLIARFKIAAMKRGEQKECDRKDFFMYIDEAGLIPPVSVGDLLSEARKYRLGLVLSTQYTKQLSKQMSNSRKDTLLDSVIGNVGTITALRLGKDDAHQMAPIFWPEFSPLDIVRLPNFHGYAKMQSGSRPSSPFSFRTRPLSSHHNRELAEYIRRTSSERYGTDPSEVEVQIEKRRKPWATQQTSPKEDK